MTTDGDGGGAERLHYAHAPILEASFLIVVERLSDDQRERLKLVGEFLGSAYRARPVKSEDADDADHELDPSEVVYSNEDEKRVVRAKPDGVLFSWQAPYDSWEKFAPEVRRSWEAYNGAVGPASITHVTVTYVNSIKIPMQVPLHDLFNTYPMLPDRNMLMTELLMNYSVSVDDPSGALSVTMVWLGSRRPDRPFMLLNNRFTFPVSNEAELWELMPRIRSIKNATFESQVTPRLKETFK